MDNTRWRLYNFVCFVDRDANQISPGTAGEISSVLLKVSGRQGRIKVGMADDWNVDKIIDQTTISTGILI